MKTITIYLNENGELADELYYFLEHGNGEGAVLRYSSKQMKEKNFEENLRLRLEDLVGHSFCWRLLLVDDRWEKLSPDKLYGENSFPWKIIDLFRPGGSSKFSREFPEVILVITSISADSADSKKQGTEASDKGDKARKSRYELRYELKEMENHICDCPVRFFYYDFNSSDGDYDRRRFSFAFVLSELLSPEFSPAGCKCARLYQTLIEWDARMLWDYLEDEGRQYRKKADKLDEILSRTENQFTRPIYEDDTPVLPEWNTGRKRFELRRRQTASYEKEVEELKKKIQGISQIEFARIRQTYYSRDRYEWNVKEIIRVKNSYEDGLRQLYKEGVWDPQKTEEKIRKLSEYDTSHRTASEFLWFLQIAMILVAVWTLYGRDPSLSAFFLLLLVFLFFVAFSRERHPKKWTEVAYTAMKNEIEQELQGVRLRLQNELAYLSRYRQAYHEYNNIIKLQNEWRQDRQRALKDAERQKILDEVRARLSRVIEPDPEDKKQIRREICAPAEKQFSYPFIREFRIKEQEEDG